VIFSVRDGPSDHGITVILIAVLCIVIGVHFDAINASRKHHEDSLVEGNVGEVQETGEGTAELLQFFHHLHGQLKDGIEGLAVGASEEPAVVELWRFDGLG
jgi:hypothetical protein